MSGQIFSGVACGAGGHRLHVAVVDAALELLELRAMPPREAADLLCAHRQIAAGLCVPLQTGTAGRRGGAGRRSADQQIKEHGLPAYRSGGASKPTPGWITAGRDLARRLSKEGFRTGRQPVTSPRRLIETPPAACFAALLGQPPFSRSTLEGRLQRQLLLNEGRMRIADAMDVLEELTAHHLLSGSLNLADLCTPDELDALVAALTVRQAILNPGLVAWLGSEPDGWVCLPSRASTLPQESNDSPEFPA